MLPFSIDDPVLYVNFPFLLKSGVPAAMLLNRVKIVPSWAAMNFARLQNSEHTFICQEKQTATSVDVQSGLSEMTTWAHLPDA